MRVEAPLGVIACAAGMLAAQAALELVFAGEPPKHDTLATPEPRGSDEPDGAYIPFQDMLDSVAPCEAKTAPDLEDGELLSYVPRWPAGVLVEDGEVLVDGDDADLDSLR